MRWNARTLLAIVACGTLATTPSASLATGTQSSEPAAVVLAEGEPAPFPGVLVPFREHDLLLSEIEAQTDEIEALREAVAAKDREAAALRAQVFELYMQIGGLESSRGLHESLSGIRAESVQRCERQLEVQRWITRATGLACGAILVFRER